MKLQTNIPLDKQPYNQIDYHSKLFLLGSCFSENIGDQLSYFKFQSKQNPFGILFHPKAIEQRITDAINQRIYTEDDLFFLNERWHCFDAHSELSAPNKEKLLDNLNAAIKSTNKRINESTHIVITLGTAWIYRHIESDSIVANCHKVPQKKFLKELLSVDAITENLNAIISLIKSVNPNTSIIFTLSPIRHLKDGFVENQRSKAHLNAGIHSVIEPRKNVHYFPSYEIVMDELRDYRFYKEDMIHPNQLAIDYIWEKFSTVWISEDSRTIMSQVDKIQKGIQHKPFNSNSEAHQQFLATIQKQVEQLQVQFSHIRFK